MTASLTKKRVVSGMRTTGKLHLGNYVGALANPGTSVGAERAPWATNEVADGTGAAAKEGVK